jgi:hypothetical protein
MRGQRGSCRGGDDLQGQPQHSAPTERGGRWLGPINIPLLRSEEFGRWYVTPA